MRKIIIIEEDESGNHYPAIDRNFDKLNPLQNPWQGPWQPYSDNPCKTCPNNPVNGGSGICFCTLGSSTIWC